MVRSLEDIISFAAVLSKFRITINTEVDPYSNLHIHDGTRMIFKQWGGVLYYFDTTIEAFDEDQTIDYTFLNTVDTNTSCFNIVQIKGAD